jgi:hypothetical protein
MEEFIDRPDGERVCSVCLIPARVAVSNLNFFFGNVIRIEVVVCPSCGVKDFEVSSISQEVAIPCPGCGRSLQLRSRVGGTFIRAELDHGEYHPENRFWEGHCGVPCGISLTYEERDGVLVADERTLLAPQIAKLNELRRWLEKQCGNRPEIGLDFGPRVNLLLNILSESPNLAGVMYLPYSLFRRIAVVLEHDLGDFATALDVVNAGLAVATVTPLQHTEAERRIRRLTSKLNVR